MTVHMLTRYWTKAHHPHSKTLFVHCNSSAVGVGQPWVDRSVLALGLTRPTLTEQKTSIKDGVYYTEYLSTR